MRENSLKRKLAAGQTALGPFLICSEPKLAEICGLAGFDFIIADCEHGPISMESAESLCRAADAAGITPIVRVRKNDGPQIQRALDIGSGGVQVPQIESRADAEAAVRGAKYKPLGQRGLSFYTRAGDFMVFGSAGYTDRLNAEQMLVVHVEGISGIEKLEEIIAVPHLDVIFLGPYDLSQSLGIPGQVRNPKVLGLMKEATKRIRASGKFVGTFADTPEIAREWAALGVQYIALNVDVGLFGRIAREWAQAARG